MAFKSIKDRLDFIQKPQTTRFCLYNTISVRSRPRMSPHGSSSTAVFYFIVAFFLQPLLTFMFFSCLLLLSTASQIGLPPTYTYIRRTSVRQGRKGLKFYIIFRGWVSSKPSVLQAFHSGNGNKKIGRNEKGRGCSSAFFELR